MKINQDFAGSTTCSTEYPDDNTKKQTSRTKTPHSTELRSIEISTNDLHIQMCKLRDYATIKEKSTICRKDHACGSEDYKVMAVFSPTLKDEYVIKTRPLKKILKNWKNTNYNNENPTMCS